MDISVFLLSQDHATDSPPHRGTRTIINLALAVGLVRRIGQNAVKLTTNTPWKEVKAHARAQTRPIHKSTYRPSKMPPINVPNTIFLPPATNWQQKYAGIPFMESLSQ